METTDYPSFLGEGPVTIKLLYEERFAEVEENYKLHRNLKVLQNTGVKAIIDLEDRHQPAAA